MSIYLGDQPIAGITQPEGLENKANISLDNLDGLGEAHFANPSLDNLTVEGEKHFLNKTQITNCLTEIPQDIKLTLESGTLILKAGSKVYVPNGFEQDGTTPKFDIVTIENDVTISISDLSEQYMTFYNVTNNTIALSSVRICWSGPTAPSSLTDGTIWYNTTNNLVKRYNGTSWQSLELSLPFNISSQNSIDQVFNGFGYIGSTIFALPGVKGLIPNGRNDDGSLNNIEYTVDKVLTNLTSGNQTAVAFIDSNSGITNLVFSYIRKDSYFIGLDKDKPATVSASHAYLYYATDTNLMYRTSGSTTTNWINNYRVAIGSVIDESGRVTEFIPYNTVNILKRSDRAEISGWSMPSNKHIDLTLGSSGSTYTAPADGWIYFRINQQGSTVANNTASLSSSAVALYAYAYQASTGTATTHALYIPITKGDIYSVHYNRTLKSSTLQFWYAQGQV